MGTRGGAEESKKPKERHGVWSGAQRWGRAGRCAWGCWCSAPRAGRQVVSAAGPGLLPSRNPSPGLCLWDPHPRLTAPLRSGPAEPHSMRYFYTAMTDPGTGLPWFVEVGYVDGEIFVHYDSTARRYVPRTEWMAANMDQQYWDGQTEIGQSNEQINRESLNILRERFNLSGGEHGRGRGSVGAGRGSMAQCRPRPAGLALPGGTVPALPVTAAPSSGCRIAGDPNPSPLQWDPGAGGAPHPLPGCVSGSHTWQRMCGCDIFEDNTTRGYRQYAYNGRDFIAFDKDTKTFTAAVPEAVPTKRKWEGEGSVAERFKYYLEETCVQWLRRYVEHGKAELGRRGEGGPRCGAGGGAGAQHGELSPALTAARPQSGPRCECGGRRPTGC